MEQSHSAELFDFKNKIGEVIMLKGGHSSSAYLVIENINYLDELKIFGDDPLFSLEQNRIEDIGIKRSRLEIKKIKLIFS